jgi:CheY-like chemotaxis protein
LANHWLTTAASRGGVGDASGSKLSHEDGIAAAWERTCDFLNCSPAELAAGVAKAFHLEVANLDDVDYGALALVPKKLARSLGVLPLRASDREVTVATSEPIDFDAEREIGFVTSRRVCFEVAPPGDLRRAVRAAYSTKESRDPIGGTDMDAAYDKVQPDQSAIALAPAHTRDAPTVKICRLILYEAVRAGATEIHMSRGTTAGRIQFKVNGKLTTFIRVPLEALTHAVERIRGMAAIGDTDDRMVQPLHVRVEREPYEMQVQTIPGYPNSLVIGIPSDGDDEASEDESATATEKATWQRRDDESEGHILIVDDDDGGRLLMRTILERNGFRVSEADDGSTALPFLDHAEDVDGILLDLMMKKVDGMEVLQKVRKSRKLAALPVVILTASEDPEDERRLLRAGADDYLKKPVDHHQLIQRIQAVMKRAQSR